MNPWLPFYAFLLLAIAWTLVWAWVLRHTNGTPEPYEDVSRAGQRIRRRLFVAVVAVLASAFLVSSWWLPYRRIAAARLGAPAARVVVTGKEWQWTLSRTRVPASVPVEFDVTALDVNHGFGIYGPSGRLVAQVQAMPGYTNHLIVRFSELGQYTVRCLEYCGIPHIGMVANFEVR
jgi:cytochrome c oxidase subunit 2